MSPENDDFDIIYTRDSEDIVSLTIRFGVNGTTIAKGNPFRPSIANNSRHAPTIFRYLVQPDKLAARIPLVFAEMREKP